MTRLRIPGQPKRLAQLLCTLLFFLFSGCVLPRARAQDLDKPLQSIDEDVTSFGYAPDGRIAYSVRRNIKTKKYDLQHDDIWLQETNGKRRRLFQGDKFTRGDELFSYVVDAFH